MGYIPSDMTGIIAYDEEIQIIFFQIDSVLTLEFSFKNICAE